MDCYDDFVVNYFRFLLSAFVFVFDLNDQKDQKLDAHCTFFILDGDLHLYKSPRIR